jgi:hypothetical protein
VLREDFPTDPSVRLDEPANLGWREWTALPMLGIGAVKAKLDSGARSSSLHVEALETFHEAGVLMVRFSVRVRRRGAASQVCSAAVLDRRPVTDSGGHRSERWFIRTDIELAGKRFAADMNLTDRRAMLFPLLIGRSAMAGRFRIDSALSYTLPRPLPVAIANLKNPE